MVALQVRRRMKPCLWVPFIVDTGAPFNFVSVDVLTALGFADHVQEHAGHRGVSVGAGMSHSLIGHQFLTKIGAVLTIDYWSNRFTIRGRVH